MSMKGNFRQRSKIALQDLELRKSFHGAMDFLQEKRRTAFSELPLEDLRQHGADIRRSVLKRLPELLEELETQCTNNGIQVHWAETAEEACELVANIAKDNEVKNVVKGKSMVSEEIQLNTYLASRGIECLESDMGEYIVQLEGGHPSHIIMPAIHKSKEGIADLFSAKLSIDTSSASVDDLIGIGRKVLREKFRNADMGVSGVNFAIADSGALCLVENEGNGRMSTTAPPIHVALMGIEKVLPSFNELPSMLSLLTRSATGQIITTYLNVIGGPRRPDDRDGPDQVHLVLIDNGRSTMHNDPDLQETLACIRCGACMNHCPVYRRIGGHAYGTTYPGPIGQVVMPQIEGMEKHGPLLDACSLNGACGEACPVKIELPGLIRRLRQRRHIPKIQTLIWRIWAWTYQKPWRHRYFSRLIAVFGRMPYPKPKAWSKTRTFPSPAKNSFSELLKERRNEKH